MKCLFLAFGLVCCIITTKAMIEYFGSTKCDEHEEMVLVRSSDGIYLPAIRICYE